MSLKQLRVCPFWGPGKHPWHVGKRTAENGISSITLFPQSLLLVAEFNSKFNTHSQAPGIHATLPLAQTAVSPVSQSLIGKEPEKI